MNEKFSNSWGKKLVISSIIYSIIILGASVALFIYTKTQFSPLVWALSWGTLLIVIPVSMAFVVKGYELSSDRILIHRPFRHDVLRYEIIKKIKKIDDVKKGLVRTFGVGLYSFTGTHTNKELGLFQAYVNDWNRAVMIETLYGKHVLSPDDPDAFVAAVNERLKSNS